ncbi:putative lipid II flippase FtsW [Tomitella biformata]|uniref:putative lipid II flippase FtsW n=1 Tax=Tomitella biformata TaxID=630403 RepID=UPI0004662368|nr:putative lipid II flippase FtsW [Tomitella biformata]
MATTKPPTPASPTPDQSGRRSPRVAIGTWLRGPLTSFHLVVTVTILLTVSGLAMVLSASSVEAYARDGSAYSMFNSQLMFVGIGAVLFYLALRIPIGLLRRLSSLGMIVALVLLFLVLIPGIGEEVDGARRWIGIGSITVQPSEIMKLMLVLWGAHILVRGQIRPGLAGNPKFWLGGASLLTFVLVMLQPNLSTTIAMGIIVASLLWFTGLKMKWFVGVVSSGVLAAVILAMTSDYRAQRMTSFLNPSADPQQGGYQALQAKFSLADGGLFGRGPGQSRAKWDYLPNAHNDFIFAIIGEELGLIGCLGVLILFALFAYAGMRIAMRSLDPFLRLFAASVTVWTIAQAFINIGYVVGLLPVTGLQLPLISAGGSSTAITLATFGLLASAARHEPEAIAALRAGKERRSLRWLRLPVPVPYSPTSPYWTGSRPTKPAPVRRGPARRPAPQNAQGRNPNGDRRPSPQQRAGKQRSGQQRSGQQRSGQQQRGARRAEGRGAGDDLQYRRGEQRPRARAEDPLGSPWRDPAAGANRRGASRHGDVRSPESRRYQGPGPIDRERGSRW